MTNIARVFLAVCLLCDLCVSAEAQVLLETPGGPNIVFPQGEQMDAAALQALQKQNNVPSPNRQKPPQAPGKEGEKGKKPGEGGNTPPGKEGEAEKAKGPLENVKRSAEPPSKPDPKELKVAPNAEGLLYFQFRNQPWPAVLRWYANVCGLSFDWQELPGDYINLATQRPHSLEETGDMINRALLMRGFTMLQDDENLTIAKVEGLNPSLVPRVSPEQLSDLPPHKYVRTSFPLSWLLAEEVHQEFSSMISKNGKLTPLQSTNRLEGMDAVANLRDINEILQQEQSAIAMENLAKEFPLKYARASSVKEQLEQFLGVQSSSGGSSRSSYSSSSTQRMMQQMQQMQQQMQRQMQASQGKGGAAASRRPRSDQVYLVANERSNSIIVHAPPNKLAIIASFITRVDVRNSSAADFTRLQSRMKVFRLASLSPQDLVDSLTAMDVLEPATKLQVDDDNNAIIAYASVADQYLIQSVIERLDGSERRFEVVDLRRLDAESVAGSIKFLMGADEEKGSRRRSYDYWDWGYRSSSRNQGSEDKMRVGANVQDNQLLLWVNDIEMEEIQNLLVKLGEIPSQESRASTVRVIDASRQPETYEYLKRLKEQWDRVSPNPLIIPDAAEFEPPSTEEESSESTESEETKQDDGSQESDAKSEGQGKEPPPQQPADSPDKITFNDSNTAIDVDVPLSRPLTRFVSDETTDGPQEDENNTKGNKDDRSAMEKAQDPPAVRIVLDESGRLIIQSDDTAALDRLEQIMQKNKPPKRPYDVFEIEHARASWVSLNLEEYFEKNEDSRPSIFAFFGDDFSTGNDKEAQLGDKPPLRFIWDNDTNTIVVQGADDLDRKTIKELIELWDVPEQVDKSSIRYTKLIKVKYSKASNIVNTIKEAYRDLLSANDKTFQDGGEGENESKRSGGSGIQGDGFNFSGLKGKLSLGPDALTNSILISVEGEDLLKIVEDIITELDEAAKDQGAVEVYKVMGGIGGRSLEKALRSAISASTAQGQAKPNANQPNKQPAEAQSQQNVEAVFNAGQAPSSRGRSRSGRR